MVDPMRRFVTAINELINTLQWPIDLWAICNCLLIIYGMDVINYNLLSDYLKFPPTFGNSHARL